MRLRTSGVAILLLTLVIATGCSSKGQTPPQSLPDPASPVGHTEPAPPAPARDEPAGATRVELDTIPPPPSVPTQTEGWADTSSGAEPGDSTFGYRVQIFASATSEGAEEAAADARTRFSEAVHIDFEAPFYKVRVGDCVTRHEAERIKERAVEFGYEGPFIAETMVDVR